MSPGLPGGCLSVLCCFALPTVRHGVLPFSPASFQGSWHPCAPSKKLWKAMGGASVPLPLRPQARAENLSRARRREPYTWVPMGTGRQGCTRQHWAAKA